MDQNMAKFVTDAANMCWWLLASFWTISGAFSTLATRLPPPYNPQPGQDLTIAQKIEASRIYTFGYKLVNFIAQNVGFARNSMDPTWRQGIETTIRVLSALIATGSMGSGAESVIKKAADLDAELTRKEQGDSK